MGVISKYVVQSEWSDAPHLSPETRAQLENAYPPHERDARTKGIPQLGSGAIYPVPESEIVVAPFDLPKHFKHVYGMDVGWNRTAAIWGAHDTEADKVYLYAEYYRGQAEPPIHAQGIKSPGAWIPGVIDPASRGRQQSDGSQLLQAYVALGLSLTVANNSVETGIYEVWTRLSTGRMKVFSTLSNWLMEYRMYRRDEKGRVVKDNDHLMDATRYLTMSGLQLAAFRPSEQWPILRKSQRRLDDYDPFAEMNERGNA